MTTDVWGSATWQQFSANADKPFGGSGTHHCQNKPAFTIFGFILILYI